MKFLDKYDVKKNIRFNFFKMTLNLVLKRNLKIIVETGTSRGKKKFFFFKRFNWKDGMSTLMLAEFASIIKGELHSCDISRENINNAKNFTKKFIHSVFYYVEDSVSFLHNFPKKIDFLYLDSFDGHNVEIASKHQFNEAKAVINKMSDNALILLDDKGSKTLYSLDYFLNNNYKIISESKYQILLSK